MANDNEKQIAEQHSISNDYLRTIAEAVSQNAGTAAGGMFVAAPEKRSFLKGVVKVLPRFVNRTTLSIALALAATFGFVAPDTATKLRNIVAMLPSNTGDLLN